MSERCGQWERYRAAVDGWACATQQPDAERVRRQVSIALQARLLAPYAVMVR